MVFKEGDEHTRGCDAGVVERVGQIHLAVRTLDADAETAGLCVAEIRAGANLEIFLLARAPRLNVAGFDLQIGQIAGAAFELTNGNLHVAEQLNRIAPELVVPVHGFLRTADDDHFLLFKLVDAVHAALFQTVAADLLAEAGGIAREGQGEFCLRDDLVDKAANHGVLARADEIEVLALDFVHHRFHLREGHDALDDVAVHHERRDDIRKALLVDHEVARVGQNRLVQAGNVAQQIIKAHTGHTACGILVDAVKGLHDVDVMGNLKIGYNGIAKALHFNVMAVVRADGNGGVDDVRDHVHDLAQLVLGLGLLLFKLRAALVVGLDLGVVFIDLLLQFRFLPLIRFFQLAIKRTVCLRQLVAGGLQLLAFLLRSTLFRVEPDGLVYERQLCILKLFPDIFADCVRIFP